jgi:hypothetical protein
MTELIVYFVNLFISAQIYMALMFKYFLKLVVRLPDQVVPTPSTSIVSIQIRKFSILLDYTHRASLIIQNICDRYDQSFNLDTLSEYLGDFNELFISYIGELNRVNLIHIKKTQKGWEQSGEPLNFNSFKFAAAATE